MGEKFLPCLASFTHARAPGISLCSEEVPQTEPRYLPCLLVYRPLHSSGRTALQFPEGVTDILGRPVLFDSRTLKRWPDHRTSSLHRAWLPPNEWLGGLLARDAMSTPVTGSKMHGDPRLRGRRAWLHPSCTGGFLDPVSAESPSDESPAPGIKG